ncbi:hypothetical protein H4R99_006143 [Coemansia sp. RSA 1722]|nr:hypothetical protein H4R99_006143 [Coemansia sp. RSA 1722]
MSSNDYRGSNDRESSAQHRAGYSNSNEYIPPALENSQSWKRDSGTREEAWAADQGQSEAYKQHRAKTKAGYFKQIVPPCPMNKYCRRTLFMRMDKSAVIDRNEIRNWFSSFGEVSFVLDLVRKSGICYVMYYDSRCAQKALRQAGDQIMISGISIQLYPSKPRPDAYNRSPHQDDHQATVVFTLNGRNAAFHDEDKDYFSEFGGVCDFYPYKNRHNEYVVEYFDTRSASKAGLTCHDTEFRGGRMYSSFFWDGSVTNVHSKTGSSYRALSRDRLFDSNGLLPRGASPDTGHHVSELSSTQNHRMSRSSGPQTLAQTPAIPQNISSGVAVSNRVSLKRPHFDSESSDMSGNPSIIDNVSSGSHGIGCKSGQQKADNVGAIAKTEDLKRAAEEAAATTKPQLPVMKKRATAANWIGSTDVTSTTTKADVSENKTEVAQMSQSSSAANFAGLASIIPGDAKDARHEQAAAPMTQSTMDVVARLLTDPSLIEKALAAKEFLQRRELVGPDFGAHLNSAAVAQIAPQGAVLSLPPASSSITQPETKPIGHPSKPFAFEHSAQPILQRHASHLSSGIHDVAAAADVSKSITALFALAPRAEKVSEKDAHLEAGDPNIYPSMNAAAALQSAYNSAVTKPSLTIVPTFTSEPLISPVTAVQPQRFLNTSSNTSYRSSSDFGKKDHLQQLTPTSDNKHSQGINRLLGILAQVEKRPSNTSAANSASVSQPLHKPETHSSHGAGV